MSEVAMIGIDLAKRVFQLHGACANGTVVFRKKLTRIQLLDFMSQQSECTVAMEACATAHNWGREFEKLGHTARLIAPNYVKPFVKRQKNSLMPVPGWGIHINGQTGDEGDIVRTE